MAFLFVAELEEPKIGISGKGLKKEYVKGYNAVPVILCLAKQPFVLTCNYYCLVGFCQENTKVVSKLLSASSSWGKYISHALCK